jgi:uncharacterized lipoprotein
MQVFCAIMLATLAACSSRGELEKCSKPSEYQKAQEIERVQVPSDLDSLDKDQLLGVPPERAQADDEDANPCLALPPDLEGTGS